MNAHRPFAVIRERPTPEQQAQAVTWDAVALMAELLDWCENNNGSAPARCHSAKDRRPHKKERT